MKKNMFNLRIYPFEITHQDGTLKGQIVYNSKDYHVELTHPFEARNSGKHMMYSIPSRFTTPLDVDRDQRTDGVVRLEDVAPEELIEIYETYKDIPFDTYTQTLLSPHRDALCTAMIPHLVAIQEAKNHKKHLRKQLKSGQIDNKEHGQLAKENNRRISQLQRHYRNELDALLKELKIPPLKFHMSQAVDLVAQWCAEASA